jgi:membrane-associated phospholipid phosphatase
VLLGVPETLVPHDGHESDTGLALGASQAIDYTTTLPTLWQRDCADFLDVFCSDVKSVFSYENALTLLAAGGLSFAFHETLDENVADYTADHPNRWGKVQDVIGGIGNPLHHLAVASGMYAYSLLCDDVEANELGKSLFNATAIATVSATLLKFAANTERPNGDSHGWPSGHTASSVAFAAVLHEYYGPCVGLPAYALAGLVAWERIDDREHDPSDVVFGAALGYVIGRTVACQHGARFCGLRFEPYVDASTGASGVAAQLNF